MGITTLSFCWTEADHQASAPSRSGPGAGCLLYIVNGVLGLLILALLWWLVPEPDWIPGMAGLLQVLLIMVLLVQPVLVLRRRKRTGPIGAGRLIVTPDGLICQQSGYTRTWDWHQLQALRVGSDGVWFYFGRHQIFPVPIRAFSDPQQLLQLIRQVHVMAGRRLPAQPQCLWLKSLQGAACNLIYGMRVAFAGHLRPQQWHSGGCSTIVVVLLYAALQAGYDYYMALPRPQYSVYGLLDLAWPLLLSLVVAQLIARWYGRGEQWPLLWLILGCACLPVALVYAVLLLWLLENEMPTSLYLLHLSVACWLLSIMWRVLEDLWQLSLSRAQSGSLIFMLAGVLLMLILPRDPWFYPGYTPAVSGQQPERPWAQLSVEDLYYRQGQLLQHSINAVPKGDRELTELYFVGFAGEADEAVFSNDVRAARQALQARFPNRMHAVILQNNYDSAAQLPLANRHNLQAVFNGIAQRMNPDQDILFLFASSHGAEDHTLSVSLYPARLDDLPAQQLKNMLDEAGIKYRVIVISACFSGGFLDILKDEHSLIMTSSRRDRVSYGCGDFTEYTYFTRAYFVNALSQASDFKQAFARSSEEIAQREAEEELEASEPQIHAGKQVQPRLEALWTEQ